MVAAVSAPSIGPTTLVLFGLNLPVAAIIMGLAGLVLARWVAPKSVRRLTTGQEVALTVLLALLLVVIVSGEAPFGDGQPMRIGPATCWGIGLGTLGLVAVEAVSKPISRALNAIFGGEGGASS